MADEPNVRPADASPSAAIVDSNILHLQRSAPDELDVYVFVHRKSVRFDTIPNMPSRRRASTSSDRVGSRDLTPDAFRRNAILVGLEAEEVELVIEHGSLVDFGIRAPIYESEAPITTVYFPLSCVLSVVTQMADGNQIEVGTIGREGVSAIPLLLGASSTANDAYCQVPGEAIEISTTLFQHIKTAATVRQLLDRYLQAYVNMLGQMAACNRLHDVYERCARWLLMTQDRVVVPEIRLTHEYLAMMLGTQRSGVTIAAGTLQKAGLIEYRHGVVKIVDRLGLEAASCECYQVARQQFAGLLRSVINA